MAPAPGLVAVLLLAPVLAAPLSPARARDVAAGPPCAMTTSHDSTGLVADDRSERVGELDAGPWVVANPTTVWVTIRCTIQYGSADPAYGGVTRASTTPGPAGALSTPVRFFEHPGSVLYLCTKITWQTQAGVESYQEDDDPVRRGVQCPLATPVDPPPAP